MTNLTPKQFLMMSTALLVLGAAWIGISTRLPGRTETPGIPAPQTGFLAPDFTLNTLEGETVTLSALRGQAVIVNIWASWCVPCRAEMPALQTVYDEYANQGLALLAVNATSQDSVSAAAGFIDELGLDFTVLLDTHGDVGRLYQVSALPSTFFIFPDGSIAEVVIGGPMAEALLRTRVERLLAEVE